ncbi:hypothetical protein Tco_0872669 [Tanacetum coccineum]
MAQDNGYAFVEVQEDGTKTICIDCWFEAQPGHGMSFNIRPKLDREAMWVHCQMHRSRMGHTTTNRGLAATGITGLVVGQGLGRGNTTIPVKGDYLIGLEVRSTTTTSLDGGSVKTGSITVLEVIDDCMSPQRTDSIKDETEPPATHGTRSPTSKSLTNQITKVDPPAGLFVNHIRSLFECDFVSLDSILQSKNPLWITPSLLAPLRKLIMLRYCSLAMVFLCVLLTHYRLNIEDHEHPIITTIQIPQWGMNFLESYGYMDLMLILIQIPHLLHMEGKLFESHGCLLLVCRNDIGYSEFTIYEMMKGCSVWSVRYRVDTDDFMTPLPEGWLIQSTVWSIVLGEREEDSFLVINLSGKVVQYNLILKTLHEIHDCGSNQLDDY